MIYFQMFTTFGYKSLKNSDIEEQPCFNNIFWRQRYFESTPPNTTD